MADNNSSGGGVGLFGLLGLAFIVLKLVGVIYAVAKLLDHREARKVRTKGWEGGA